MSQKSADFYRKLLEHGETASLILDRQGGVVYCTPATERWLNLSLSLAGAHPFHLIHPEDAAEVLREFNELVLTAGATRSLRVRVRGAGGEWHALYVIAANALDDDAVGGVMINARDVTDTERLKDSLFHAQRMELTGRLAAGVAHDFNNALTIILGHADLIAAHATDPGTIDVSEIRQAARGAAALARRLLSLGRKQRVYATDVDVDSALEGIHRLLQPVVGERISFTHSLSELAMSVFIDPVRLDQALVNLVLNARDAISDRGFIRLSAEPVRGPQVEGSELRSWARIRVSDSGHGMTSGVANRAFEPHFTTKEATGIGLGLAMVRETVAEAGGTVRIVSDVDTVGTVIEMLLPANLSDIVEAPEATAATTGGHETIVLVEDDAAVRQSIARTLHDAGYSVLEVPTVMDGVWLSDELLARAALVVADEVLPDSSGHELVATFRHRKPGLPVLYMSGYPMSEGVARHLDERTDFLPKPFDRTTLLRRLRRLLGGVREG